MLSQVKKRYHSIVPEEFRDNWYRYVTSSWKRLGVFELFMLIPIVNVIILLMTFPIFGTKRTNATATIFMNKASHKDVMDAFWLTIGLTGLNYALYAVIRFFFFQVTN